MSIEGLWEYPKTGDHRLIIVADWNFRHNELIRRYCDTMGQGSLLKSARRDR